MLDPRIDHLRLYLPGLDCIPSQLAEVSKEVWMGCSIPAFTEDDPVRLVAVDFTELLGDVVYARIGSPICRFVHARNGLSRVTAFYNNNEWGFLEKERDALASIECDAFGVEQPPLRGGMLKGCSDGLVALIDPCFSQTVANVVSSLDTHYTPGLATHYRI